MHRDSGRVPAPRGVTLWAESLRCCTGGHSYKVGMADYGLFLWGGRAFREERRRGSMKKIPSAFFNCASAWKINTDVRTFTRASTAIPSSPHPPTLRAHSLQRNLFQNRGFDEEPHSGATSPPLRPHALTLAHDGARLGGFTHLLAPSEPSSRNPNAKPGRVYVAGTL